MTDDFTRRRARWRTSRLILRRRSAQVGLALLTFVLLLSLWGMTLDPYPPRAFPCLGVCGGLPPFADVNHLFGTYPSGQDVLSEVAHGAPIDLTIGFGATVISVAIGTSVGVIAGYGTGPSRDLVLTLIQIVLLLPSFAILVWFYRAYGGTDLFQGPLLTNYLMILLGAFSWPPVALVVRNSVAALNQEEFIDSSRALGASRRHVIFKHILPNIATPILAVATLIFAVNITAESLFTYLGLVNPQSDVVTWGFLIWEGSRVLLGYWWISFFPGLMIVVTVLGFNLLSDAISETLNPVLRSGA